MDEDSGGGILGGGVELGQGEHAQAHAPDRRRRGPTCPGLQHEKHPKQPSFFPFAALVREEGLLHRLRLTEGGDGGIGAEAAFSEARGEGAPHPGRDRRREALLLALHDHRRQTPGGKATQAALALPLGQLLRGGNGGGEFDELLIKEWRAHLQRVRHAHAIDLREHPLAHVGVPIDIEHAREGIGVLDPREELLHPGLGAEVPEGGAHLRT